MKVIDDIWSSIWGSSKTRVTDPFVGTFIVSWVICNWNYLALLFLGEGSATERVSGFYMYLSHSEVIAINSIFTVPFLLTILYLFIFPWISLLVKFLQATVNNRLHQQAVNVDLSKVIQQEDLNKAKLKANPDKQFLEQNLQLEIDRKKELSEQRKQRTLRFEIKATEAALRAKEATAKAEEAESKRNSAKIDEEKKKSQAELERQRFSISSAEVRATLASHRFPSAYLFMSLISDSVNQDGITLSLSATSKVVAAIFGYKDFESLIGDDNFNNEHFSNVEYIYYDDSELAKRLEGIVSEEGTENEDLTSEMLFEHIRMIFEELPYKFVDLDELTQLSVELCENDSFSLLDYEGTASSQAESDTDFDEVYVEGAENAEFNHGFTANINASASGSHRKESDITGRDMSILAQVTSSVVLGEYALGPLELIHVNGGLVDYWEDEAHQDSLDPSFEVALKKYQGFNEFVRYISENIKVGGKLPAERKLSEILNSNRSVIRESLARLESFGFIFIEHGKSTILIKELPEIISEELVE
ncbi:GntR family transcriptional regulator [Shewanella goraebulensis]|uniref:GntR family transcriptional regulator n=1 Tax=Shewanella goraebulensis TaxID=3050637 RepID=UPI002551AED2|nr:GntR family transcriptional regulator [Shewanella goraebulensis]